MPRPADFHDPITDAHRQEAARVVNDATTLHAAVDVLDAYAATRDASIRGLLRAGEFASPWLPSRHDDLDVVERRGQKAKILKQLTARG